MSVDHQLKPLRNFNDKPFELTRKQFKGRLKDYSIQEDNYTKLKLDKIYRTNSALLLSFDGRDSK